MKGWALFLLILASFVQASAQSDSDVQIQLGPSEIGENQAWTITVTVNNDRIKSYNNFPDIRGMRKQGTSTSSQTSIVNGRVSSSESVTMTYLPTQQGIFTLSPFQMTVNGKIVQSQGIKIKVGPAVQAQQQQDPFSSFFNQNPFDDFFGRHETDYVDVKEDAFLALTTDKPEVYVGEGFNTTLAFYVAENNKAPISWYELGKQLSDILKEIKPVNCWEENFNIENIDGEMVTIGGKPYTKYTIYQATFYPLNAEPVTFPKVGLQMIKYKVATNPTFFGQNRKEGFKTFYTKPKTVRVKELPPFPLRESVAVGDYRLDEKLDHSDVKTGESVKYNFSIYGEGNISSIEKPTVKKDEDFDFYEPNVHQSINRQHGMVTGTKTFSYFLVPKNPGTYNLGKYFQWIYFNPRLKRYDTLKSKLTMDVTGESKKNLAIESNDTGAFYDKIQTADNSIRLFGGVAWLTWVFNAFILVILGASLYLVFKK